mgnify:CR=1 FL=1
MDQAKNWIHCDGAYRLGLDRKGCWSSSSGYGDFPHRDFEDRVVCFADFVKGRREAYDDNGHGTHIAGL